MSKPLTQFCPVPSEQQPLNEYEQLQESWFFRWASLETLPYLKKLAWIWLWGWVIAGPIAAASFPPQREPVRFGTCGAAGAGLLVGLVVLRLCLGWAYVHDRLKEETVCYEESGWYDGQTWQKPAEIWQRDRLIASYQVKPLLRRLQWTAIILLVALVSSTGFIWL